MTLGETSVPLPADAPAAASPPAPVRLALVGPTHPYKGGIAQHTTQLAGRLAARGVDVRLDSWSSQYPAMLYPGRQRVDGPPEVPPYPRTAYPLAWYRPDGWWSLGAHLRTRVDALVVVVASPVQVPAYATVLRAARGSRGGSPRPRQVVLCHNVLPHERRRVDEPLMRSLLRSADAVMVHSEAEREQAASLGAHTVGVAPLAPFLPLPPDLPAPDPDRPATRRLLFFGLVRPYKGLDVLVRAVAAGPPDVGLDVYGEFWGGPEETQTLVDGLGIAARVRLRPGYVAAADLPGVFAGADAVVLPYRSSTSSSNVQLAHALGVPVVATRVGTMARDVRDGVDGLLVPPDDPAALAAAVSRLYADGTLRRLRRGVEPPDLDAPWRRYTDVLLGLTAGGTQR